MWVEYIVCNISVVFLRHSVERGVGRGGVIKHQQRRRRPRQWTGEAAADGKEQRRRVSFTDDCDNHASIPTPVLVQVGFEYRIFKIEFEHIIRSSKIRTSFNIPSFSKDM